MPETIVLQNNGSDKVRAVIMLIAFLLFGGVIIGAVVSLFISALSVGFILTVMGFAFVQNTVAGMQSRAGNRNSSLYYALTLLGAGPIFYLTLRFLVRQDMSLTLIAPYTVATVLGSLFGARVSMAVERMLKITTRTDISSIISHTVTRNMIIGILVMLSALAFIVSGYSWDVIIVALLAMTQNGTYSLMRRSRNVNKAWYHTFAAILNGLTWYFLFKSLVLHRLPITLLPAYALGAVSGGVISQRLGIMFEKTIGAVADAYLDTSQNTKHWIAPMLVVCYFGILLAYRYQEPLYALGVMVLAMLQNISFSLISRARNRGSMLLHAAAAVLSNGVWYLTFRVLATKNLPLSLLGPYLAGTIVGSLAGIAMSIPLERLFKALSDDHVLNTQNI